MTRTKIPIDNRPPFRRRFRPTTLRRLSARPARRIRIHTRRPVIQRVTPCRTHSARSLSGPLVREICNQMPNPSISAPPPRSYRLRRHFPRHCDVTTRILHPYKPRSLRYRTAAGFIGLRTIAGFTLRIPGFPLLQSPSPTPGRLSDSRPSTGLRPQNPDSYPGFLLQMSLTGKPCPSLRTNSAYLRAFTALLPSPFGLPPGRK